MTHSSTRRGQRGFSLIVIFLLLALMAAAATAVLLASRTDMRISGRHRESSLSFFSAEAGVAYAKQALATRWNATTYWTGVLSDAPVTTSYEVGGIEISQGNKLPKLNSRFTYTFRNNLDDPSGDPMIDSDGKVIVTSVGQSLDVTGNKVLAQVTLQVEVEWVSVSIKKGGYQAQQNQSGTGVANSPDTGGVDLSTSRSF
ncbi:MAG: hypothetical protein ABI333_07360 [bacterium]